MNTIDGVLVEAVDEETAKVLRHDSVGPPSRDQEANWKRQVQDEKELPFTDEDE